MNCQNNVSQCLHLSRFCVADGNAKTILQCLNQLNSGKRIEIPEKCKLLGEIVCVSNAGQVCLKNLGKDLTYLGHRLWRDTVLSKIMLPKLAVVERLSASKNLLQLLLLLLSLSLAKALKLEPAHKA